VQIGYYWELETHQERKGELNFEGTDPTPEGFQDSTLEGFQDSTPEGFQDSTLEGFPPQRAATRAVDHTPLVGQKIGHVSPGKQGESRYDLAN
jgi:hypothetical protein